ncbi:phosphoribosylformylglycinamidine synthase subunit PurL [Solirubrobacter phytolaccae]|uniref:Phosphoribosylformylglycinamidine synthase subunit PurL n=1 Tax=Solirubrobacter phytolaccae TaxID=1404360 RepID=A0A9X3S6A2_9ACTN|nr:phosphoribosylformylglycinamidine synthase subunit PurL [Solirubrobacter phytolaccae]MDA0179704.1 phosphoribosylformylglycinamidine synthase subunit PurL [Solirubrobacter phytolaccae]
MSKHRELGLTDFEYDLIVEKMGREPNEVELAVFSLMWSEHCGYKHSRPLLKTLPVEGPRLVMGPGENAGAVDVGNGLSCAFKVESHNHPSAVEPFQGAATGVGGILRDIFAIGARPIAILDSLRFGEVADSARSRYLLEHAVAGIGHYGNSIGIATVGGEIYFEEPYEQNCLVNAMAVGLIETDELIKSAAAGVGNVVVLFGARTGRDGIGGASVLASAELDADMEKRPTVQIGDPFEEKKLLECSLELLDRKLLVALQDLGAAGITSSSAEMAAKGEVGLDLHVRRVPLREQDMHPFEIMISESQERMLCVVEPDRVDEVLAVCAKWEVNGTAIGEVTDTRRLRVFDGDELVGDLPVTALVDECPTYTLEPAEPTTPLYPAPPKRIDTEDPGEILLALLGSANLASRKAVFEQYDSLVGSRTVRRPEQADAAVLLLPDPANGDRLTSLAPPRDDDAPKPAIAVSIDGNGRRVAADPYRGAVEAVLECSANLACVGAEPLGLTNCLNFGNPEKPHIAWQFSRAIAGLGDACRAFGIPVVGGNVSLYNEGASGPIYPTPVVGLVGELPDARKSGRLAFQHAGDVVAIVAADSWAPSNAASELSKLRGEVVEGPLPQADLGELKALHAAIRQAVRSGSLSSAHDVAEGGVAVTLAESAIHSGLGATIGRLEDLFGEGPGAFIVTGPADAITAFGAAAKVIGEVGGDTLIIEGAISVPVADLERAFTGGLADLLH